MINIEALKTFAGKLSTDVAVEATTANLITLGLPENAMFGMWERGGR